MALKPDTNPYSQFMRLAFLRSPNFVHDVSGWSINQDGSAEFNNVQVRGNLVGAEMFLYNGTPAFLNPPIFWITTGTTDPYGNTVSAAAGTSGLPVLVYSPP